MCTFTHAATIATNLIRAVLVTRTREVAQMEITAVCVECTQAEVEGLLNTTLTVLAVVSKKLVRLKLIKNIT